MALRERTLQIVLAALLAVNIISWFCVRHVQARWYNVPPSPEKEYAAIYGLGDTNFSYRLNGLMLQNLGDTGGRSTPLKDYNYNSLTKWFYLQDQLDPYSDYVPYLAAYYFGGVQEPKKLRPMLEYLREVGHRTYKEKWRWLAQAVFLARFRMEDMNYALKMAEELARLDHPDLPAWALHMPVFVMNAKGEKQAAYTLMLGILKSSAEKLHPEEVYSMRIFMCTRLLEKDEAQKNSLCEDIIK